MRPLQTPGISQCQANPCTGAPAPPELRRRRVPLGWGEARPGAGAAPASPPDLLLGRIPSSSRFFRGGAGAPPPPRPAAGRAGASRGGGGGHQVAARRGARPAAQTPRGSGEGLGLGSGPRLIWGGAARLQLAAAGPGRRGPASGGPARGHPRPPAPAPAPLPQEPARCARAPRPSSLGSLRLRSAAAGRRRPLLRGPGAAEAARGAAEGRRKRERSRLGSGRDSRGGVSANLRALTRGAAPRLSDICRPGRGAPRGSAGRALRSGDGRCTCLGTPRPPRAPPALCPSPPGPRRPAPGSPPRSPPPGRRGRETSPARRSRPLSAGPAHGAAEGTARSHLTATPRPPRPGLDGPQRRAPARRMSAETPSRPLRACGLAGLRTQLRGRGPLGPAAEGAAAPGRRGGTAPEMARRAGSSAVGAPHVVRAGGQPWSW